MAAHRTLGSECTAAALFLETILEAKEAPAAIPARASPNGHRCGEVTDDGRERCMHLVCHLRALRMGAGHGPPRGGPGLLGELPPPRARAAEPTCSPGAGRTGPLGPPRFGLVTSALCSKVEVGPGPMTPVEQLACWRCQHFIQSEGLQKPSPLVPCLHHRVL